MLGSAGPSEGRGGPGAGGSAGSSAHGSQPLEVPGEGQPACGFLPSCCHGQSLWTWGRPSVSGPLVSVVWPGGQQRRVGPDAGVGAPAAPWDSRRPVRSPVLPCPVLRTVLAPVAVIVQRRSLHGEAPGPGPPPWPLGLGRGADGLPSRASSVGQQGPGALGLDSGRLLPV